MKVNQNALMDAMKKMGYETKLHDDTQQFYTSYTFQESEYPIFVRTLSDGNLVQVITFIPCTVVDSAVFDLSRFLHIVNKELDMPGFCMDEETKTVFYRIVIPCIDQTISDNLFEAYISTSKNICQTFGTVIQAIAVGVMTLDEVFEKMAEKSEIKKK